MKYAEVIVDVPVRRVNKIFHYNIPTQLEDKVVLGSKVTLPFGKRYVEGYVVGFAKDTEIKEIKDIKGVKGKEPFFTEETLNLAKWISEKYFCSYIDALNCVVPTFAKEGNSKVKGIVMLGKAPKEIQLHIEKLSKGAPKQAALLKEALKNVKLGIEEIAAAAQTTRSTVTTLVNKGLLKIEEESVYRDPYKEHSFKPSLPFRPTYEQEGALKALGEGIEREEYQTFLVHGVTGSGKTEIYLQAIEKVLAKKKQVIVLVPEISLTPQMVERFKSRFGSKVAVLHSRLSNGERFDEWQKIKEHEVEIVVGARSAVFAPFQNLGLIIIDEEHESTYKQEETPKYHTREVAIKRAQLVKGIVLLGSATPALETYHRALKKEFQLITLKERVENRPLPQVKIIDLREEIKAGHKSIFSRYLLEKIDEKLRLGEQIILFLNRRGYSTFVNCRECGLVLKCPNCSIPLTYHATDGSLHCHYCDVKKATPKTCPKCSSKYIKFFGIGTQKIEEEFKRIYPRIKALRMDVDTTGKKGAHEKILSSFQRGEAQVLIGTQMIAKGLDFPNVTLVGVITADTSLNMPDFLSAEKTFQLLTQVAGRAGRGLKPGEVAIQTYNPEHYSLISACKQDYLGFFQQEIELRKVRTYPPFSVLIKIVVSGEDEAKVINQAMLLGDIYKRLIQQKENMELLGPVQAPIEKIRRKYRWQLVLKGLDEKELMGILEEGYQKYEEYSQGKQVKISIDVNPQGLL